MQRVTVSLCALVVGIFASGCKGFEPDHPPAELLKPTAYTFKEHPGNPIIQYGDVKDGILWNDPSVIRENGGYTMWLTGGKPFEKEIRVDAYRATSTNGIDWEIDPEPVLEPGKKGTWDDQRIETPSVIKVGDTYHMYYSGCSAPCQLGAYDTGHATSRDGINWTKDPRNPILKREKDPMKWGFFTAAEPGVVHFKGKFYLYHTGARSNHPKPGAPFAILLATSEDGSRFKRQGAVIAPSEAEQLEGFRGYSTPMAFVHDGEVHLYYDRVWNPDGFSQVALSYATSKDGWTFTQKANNIVAVEDGWKSHSVLSPSALVNGDTTMLWFTAQQAKPFGFGIGLATRKN